MSLSEHLFSLIVIPASVWRPLKSSVGEALGELLKLNLSGENGDLFLTVLEMVDNLRYPAAISITRSISTVISAKVGLLFSLMFQHLSIRSYLCRGQ